MYFIQKFLQWTISEIFRFLFLLIYENIIMTTLELMDSILQYWKDNNAFQRSIDERSEQMQFRFFDWPPFASWDPHYGHLLAWAIKDVFPRYMTMRGFRVERKWWWDCHGLPVEKAVEKKLWIDGTNASADRKITCLAAGPALLPFTFLTMLVMCSIG